MSNTIEQLFELREAELRRASQLHDEFTKCCAAWSQDKLDADLTMALRAADKELSASKTRIVQLQNRIQRERVKFTIAMRQEGQ